MRRAERSRAPGLDAPMLSRLAALTLIAAMASACGSSAGTDGGPSSDAGGGDGDAAEARDVRSIPDVPITVEHDAGPPPPCQDTCDCPQGLACLSGTCRSAGVGAVYCCSKPGCPPGHDCLGDDDLPGRCAELPDAGALVDAGPQDIGAGALGASCGSDPECGTGLTCLEQTAPPFLWGGYCTVEGCFPACPTGSSCVSFGGTTPISACLGSCFQDQDCRSDAYCLTIPGAGLQVCFPDCRDDLFDCSPRDGTNYCDRQTGRCEATPAQNATAKIGDPCSDNRDCAAGDVCMSAFAWNFLGGMCTRVCSGLPEATPCGREDLCQDFAGVGLCFHACQNGTCPDRIDATCSAADPSWIEPACIPQ